jgi:NTE family protein
LVLGGGGNLGALQIGQLRALAEREVVPDMILGCSIGAMNGAAFASDPTRGGVARLEAIWTDLAKGSAAVMPSSRVPNAVQMLRKGESLYSNDGLRSTIERFLGDRRTFEDLVVPFQCVATAVDEAREYWFDHGDLVEPILASAALPAVYPIVTIDGRRYLDGGVVNNVPLERAVDLGARRVYVCHTGLHGRPNPEVERPLDAALIAYWVTRNARLARDLAKDHGSTEIIVLSPGPRPDIRLDDFSHTGELVEQGYRHASTYLDDLEAERAAGRSMAERLNDDAHRLILELRGKVAERRESRTPLHPAPRTDPPEGGLATEDMATERGIAT